jgi:hypothetical protein
MEEALLEVIDHDIDVQNAGHQLTIRYGSRGAK